TLVLMCSAMERLLRATPPRLRGRWLEEPEGAIADFETAPSVSLRSTPPRKRGRIKLLAHEDRRGIFEKPLDALNEFRGVVAVDHAVIERRRDVHPLAHDYLALDHHRLLDDRVRPNDRDFRMIDDRRRDDAAERAEARDRDRRAGEVVLRGLVV